MIFDKCPDCGVFPGEEHKPGCDNEVCPFCDGQIISCDCYNEWVKENYELDARVEPYYSKGFPEEISDAYEEYLKGKLIPFNSDREIKAKTLQLVNCVRDYSLRGFIRDNLKYLWDERK